MEMARTFDGKKFMWDGRIYESAVEVEEVRQSYQNNGFDVERVDESGQQFLFTRRVVEEVIVEGQPT